jgi:hypothetical protein
VNTATSFGNPLVVFPKNGARIGICPSYDFWDSFGIIRNRLSFPSMDDFNAIFIKIFSIIDNNLGKLAEELSEDIYDELINRLKKISKDEFLRATRLLHTKVAWLKRYEESVFEDITDNFNGDWEQYFDDLMNPEANKFQLQSIETYEKKSEFAQNEVWTDAVSLMVNESYVKELLQSPVKLPPKPGDPNLDITI